MCGEVLGKAWESVLGCRKSKGRDGVWGSVGERCGIVCWHVGEVERNGGCGEMLGEV